MDKKIIIAIVVLLVVVVAGVFVSRMDTDVPEENGEVTLDEASAIADEWMKSQSLTYTYDGRDLEISKTEEVDEGVVEVTFDFESNSAGYGDRSEEMTAQVITPHTTVVTVENGEVVSAVTDGVFDEMSGEMIEEEEEEVTTSFNVYFMIVEDGMEDVVPVERSLEDVTDVEHRALVELLSGPTEEEKEEGYSTSIDEGTELNSLNIENGVAFADFSEELDVAGGSAWVTAIVDQITNTLTQFDSIDSVEISVNGETEGVLQP